MNDERSRGCSGNTLYDQVNLILKSGHVSSQNNRRVSIFIRQFMNESQNGVGGSPSSGTYKYLNINI